METRPQLGQSDAYALALGKLLANLTTLEFALRVVLHHMDDAPDLLPKDAFKSLKVGDELPASWITSWDSLGNLIDAYNEKHNDAPEQQIPVQVKDLRDAFAHGRMLAYEPESNIVLHRFSKPRDGRVTVEAVQVLTF